MSLRSCLFALGIGLGLGLGLAACVDEGPEIGAPCMSIEDCDEDLICDIHDGQGTCQVDHGHGDGFDESDAETAGDGAMRCAHEADRDGPEQDGPGELRAIDCAPE